MSGFLAHNGVHAEQICCHLLSAVNYRGTLIQLKVSVMLTPYSETMGVGYAFDA